MDVTKVAIVGMGTVGSGVAKLLLTGESACRWARFGTFIHSNAMRFGG